MKNMNLFSMNFLQALNAGAKTWTHYDTPPPESEDAARRYCAVVRKAFPIPEGETIEYGFCSNYLDKLTMACITHYGHDASNKSLFADLLPHWLLFLKTCRQGYQLSTGVYVMNEATVEEITRYLHLSAGKRRTLSEEYM
jgi:hypothetical protein